MGSAKQRRMENSRRRDESSEGVTWHGNLSGMSRRSSWPGLSYATRPGRWDPIGLGEQARKFADDEYDCVIDFVIGRLMTGHDATEVPHEAVRFVREDMGIGADLTKAATFVDAANGIVSQAVGK